MKFYDFNIEDIKINPDLSNEERAYEIFKRCWAYQHIDRITMTQTEALYENDESNNNLHECEDTTKNMSFEEYIEEYGFANGEIYPCFDEFLNNDFGNFLYYPEIEKMIDEANDDLLPKIIIFNYRNSQLLGRKYINFDTSIAKDDSIIKTLRELNVNEITICHYDGNDYDQFDMIGKLVEYGCQLIGLAYVPFDQYNMPEDQVAIKSSPKLLFRLSKPEAVIEVEHANGETYMAFKIGVGNDGEINVTDTKDCSLADVDGDYIFESNNNLYRIQADEPISIEQVEKINDDYNDAIVKE